MKKYLEISDFKQVAVILLGLLIAVFATFSPYHQMLDADEQSNVVEQTDHDQNGEEDQNNTDDEFIVNALDAVPNAFQSGNLGDVNGYVTEFVFEAPQELIRQSPEVAHHVSKYFRTLCRYIISPNAP